MLARAAFTLFTLSGLLRWRVEDCRTKKKGRHTFVVHILFFSLGGHAIHPSSELSPHPPPHTHIVLSHVANNICLVIQGDYVFEKKVGKNWSAR